MQRYLYLFHCVSYLWFQARNRLHTAIPSMRLASVMLPIMMSMAAVAYADESTIQPGSAAAESQYEAIREKAMTHGRVRVIVHLKLQAAGTERMSEHAYRKYRKSVKELQNRIVKSVSIPHPESIKRFRHLPYLALEVDPTALAQLRDSPQVLAVTEDHQLHLSLADSVPLVGADAAWKAGYSGQGQTVAVLDTGVDGQHPFLAGKLVAEACFSTNLLTQAFESTCPNGAQEQIGPGAAAPCKAEECLHGTHVAGIAVGTGGVAKDAKLIAVQVFSMATPQTLCGLLQSCTTAWESDIAKGMEYVYSQKDRFKIAAINLSLGDGFIYPDSCDGDPVVAPIQAAAQRLRAAGIATVVAAGNDGSRHGVSRPACLPEVISVGATTKLDSPAFFSNIGPKLTLLAPGVDIVSSVPGGDYAALSGTSMATPHVVGAWAILKSSKPDASVANVLEALTSTGAPVSDYLSLLTRPRIQIDRALAALTGDTTVPPTPLTPVGPSGATAASTPTFQWTPLPQSLWYFLVVTDNDNGATHYSFARPASAGCADGKSVCALTPRRLLRQGGHYTWYVSAVGSRVQDSPKTSFTVSQ